MTEINNENQVKILKYLEKQASLFEYGNAYHYTRTHKK